MAGCGCATAPNGTGKSGMGKTSPNDIVIDQGMTFKGLTLCNTKCSNIALKCLKKNGVGNGSFTVEDAHQLRSAAVGDSVILSGLPADCEFQICAKIVSIVDREVTLDVPFSWLKEDVKVTGGFSGGSFLGIPVCPGTVAPTVSAAPMVQILAKAKNYEGLIQIGGGSEVGCIWTAAGASHARIDGAKNMIGKKLIIGSLPGYTPVVIGTSMVQGKKIALLSSPAPSTIEKAIVQLEPYQVSFTFSVDACGCKMVSLTAAETAKMAVPEMAGCKPGQASPAGKYWIYEVNTVTGERLACQEGCVSVRPGAHAGSAAIVGGSGSGC
jgi:hypothetical protein